MASHPEGLRIARQRIAEEKEKRTGFLDLGKLGLEEWPEELWELGHLTGLNLGSGWPDDNGQWISVSDELEENQLPDQGMNWLCIPNLQHLFYCRDYLRGYAWQDISHLQVLTKLEELDFCGCNVRSLNPLSKLKLLKKLRCGSNPWSDATPLEHLQVLELLDCCATNLTSLEPISKLLSLKELDISSIESLDIRPIARNSNLESIDFYETGIVGGLEPLEHLHNLRHINCGGSGVTDLEPIRNLSQVIKLDCSKNPINSLEPISGLINLLELKCHSIIVTTLDALSGLERLERLDCSHTAISDLGVTASLVSLRSLNCSYTKIYDLSVMSALHFLQDLNCSNTKVSELEPLRGLSYLHTLNCSNTQIRNIDALNSLKNLRLLDCDNTGVSNLLPLVGLDCLKSINFSRTNVSDLKPLIMLPGLKSIIASFVPIHSIPREIIWSPAIQYLLIYDTCIQSVPMEVLSPNSYTSCLKSLRAHIKDLEAGEALLPDVKVMVLGNGRIGKTQICNRLRGVEFETESDSTHGITVTTTLLGEERGHSCPPRLPTSVEDGLANPPSETSGQECPRSFHGAQATKSRSEYAHSLLRLWDFGGQDIYHGTHALFMRSRALFLLVWTPDSENSETHVHNGMTFRNQPLPFWLTYIRHLAGGQSPVLVIQNRCDTPADERLRPPVEDAFLQPFTLKKTLHYSAYNCRGHAALEEAIQDAIAHLRQTQGQAVIGQGRLKVKQHIEALQKADEDIPEVVLKKNRTITQAYFRQICEECGGVSSPDHLLGYLHQAGIVFYQEGLFDDQIILDQAWALEAVYAVFNREKCYRQLRQLKGRFTRSLLGSLVWQEHSEEEQQLFLTMMKSCGICFVHRWGDKKRGIETEYIAPDLLPDFTDVADEVAAQWDDAAVCDVAEMEVEFLHAGLMRGLLSRIGSAAGMTAVYWKDGVCLYEKKTRSHARIDQRPVNRRNASACSGVIHLRAYGGNSLQLLEMLTPWLWKEVQRVGCKSHGLLTTEHPLHMVAKEKRLALKSHTEVMEVDAEIDTPPHEMKPDFTSPPRTQTTYGVSYAWNDASQKIVNQLCDQAEKERGVKILRDVKGMGLGDSISKFMRTLTQQDRVFVILSAKYLQSPFCMYELWQIWVNCRADDEAFRQCVRVYRLPDAAMMTPLERARCAKHWKDQFKELDELVRTEGADLLGELDFKRYKLMQDFAHRVGDILAIIADMLLPRDFAELEKHGFGDESDASMPPSTA